MQYVALEYFDRSSWVAKSIEFILIPLFLIGPYFIQPALKITAILRNIVRQAQVSLLRAASALLALVNMELPLAAIPPIPSPLGL